MFPSEYVGKGKYGGYTPFYIFRLAGNGPIRDGDIVFFQSRFGGKYPEIYCTASWNVRTEEASQEKTH
jgi:hypothetical protein